MSHQPAAATHDASHAFATTHHASHITTHHANHSIAADGYACTHANGCCSRHPGLLACKLVRSSPPPLSAVCRLYDESSRYICDRGAAAQHDEYTNTLATQFAADRSIYFVGDSLSLQHAHAFACALLADEPAGNLSAVFAKHGTSRVDSECWVRRGTRGGGGGGGGGGGSRVCHVVAGEEISKPSTGEACKALGNASGLLRAGDVVVANEGVWRRAFSFSEAKAGAALELSRVGEFDKATVNALRRRGAAVLWRETAAQHFERTSTGQYKTGCKQDCGGGCSRVANPSPLAALNAEVNRLIDALGVPILPAWARSLDLWTEHVGRRSMHVQQKNILDCTHFCAPSRLFGELQALLLQHANAAPERLGLSPSRPRPRRLR